MPLIVQKFGDSSVANPEKILRAARRAICGSGITPDEATTYDEAAAGNSGLAFDKGWRLMGYFLQ